MARGATLKGNGTFIMVSNAHILLALGQALQIHLMPITTLGGGHNKELRHTAIKQLSQYAKAKAFHSYILPSMCVPEYVCEQERRGRREDAEMTALESL